MSLALSVPIAIFTLESPAHHETSWTIGRSLPLSSWWPVRSVRWLRRHEHVEILACEVGIQQASFDDRWSDGHHCKQVKPLSSQVQRVLEPHGPRFIHLYTLAMDWAASVFVEKFVRKVCQLPCLVENSLKQQLWLVSLLLYDFIQSSCMFRRLAEGSYWRPGVGSWQWRRLPWNAETSCIYIIVRFQHWDSDNHIASKDLLLTSAIWADDWGQNSWLPCIGDHCKIIWLPMWWLILMLQSDELQGFQCSEATVQNRYKYKHLRATVSNLPQHKDTAAQITTKARLSPITSCAAYLGLHFACICYLIFPALDRASNSWQSLSPNCVCASLER